MRMKIQILLLSAGLVFTHIVSSQILPYTKLYDDTKVSSIFIYLDPDSLQDIYDNLENEYEHTALFIFDDGISKDTVEDIGFRLRGNTSLSSAKKSFKVSFNTYVTGRKYEGIEKLNLLGMHNDPTMVREKLYFDTYNAMGLPVRRSNFVRVYINDDYYGLYTNMEQIDEIFVKTRFGDNSGNLYKCTWPAQLDWRGTSVSAYQNKGYELQTNEEENDWSDLIELVDVINNSSDADFVCALEEVFDVQQYLWIYALDISAGHWDNYAANINNYYLYHNIFTGKFEFLSFDCDNTFGVDWLGFDWTDQNIYNWPTGWYEVPLAERVLEVEAYRNQFSTYLEIIKNTYLQNDAVSEKVLAWRDLIADAAAEDAYRTYDWGYDFEDFWNGFNTNNIDGHTPYGITNFVERRNTYTADQLETYSMPPVVSEIQITPLIPSANTEFYINAKIIDDEEVALVWALVSFDGYYTGYEMQDNGLLNDGGAGDGIYGAKLLMPAYANQLMLDFEIYDTGGNFILGLNCSPYFLNLNPEIPTITINEILSQNNTVITDETGKYADYIELYNWSDAAVDLTGYFLSDDPQDPAKWQFPETIIQPDSYLIIWADDDGKQGPYHTNFNLDATGEFVGLYSPATEKFAVVDSVSFPQTGADISYGRIPNGLGDFTTLNFTSPGYNNEMDDFESPDFTNLPFITNNPSITSSTLYFQADGISRYEIIITDILGSNTNNVYSNVPDKGINTLPINTRLLAKGMYLLQIRTSTSLDIIEFVKL